LDRAPEALAVDETCIYFEEAPRYGYSRKGERCVYRRRQPQRTGKVTLVLAISERRGVVAYRVVKGFVNGMDTPRAKWGRWDISAETTQRRNCDALSAATRGFGASPGDSEAEVLSKKI
jgi:hypothetical protein